MKHRKQKPVLVLLGPAGSFSDLASKRFEKKYRKKYMSTFKKVFAYMKSHRDAFGFVPVHNKIVGDITPCVKLIKQYEPRIVGRLKYRIQIVLAAKKKIKVSEVECVYAPNVVVAQCGKFIKKYLSGVNFIESPFASSLSFKKIVQLKGFTAAAMGASDAAKTYKLRIIARNIQDDPRNWTEFVLFRHVDKEK